MAESIILNPKDEKITTHFGEIKGFLRNTCIVNANSKKANGSGRSGRNDKVFTVILTLKSKYILGVTGVIYVIFF